MKFPVLKQMKAFRRSRINPSNLNQNKNQLLEFNLQNMNLSVLLINRKKVRIGQKLPFSILEQILK